MPKIAIFSHSRDARRNANLAAIPNYTKPGKSLILDLCASFCAEKHSLNFALKLRKSKFSLKISAKIAAKF